MKSGNLNFLEPSGPLQACNGTALPFYKLYLCPVTQGAYKLLEEFAKPYFHKYWTEIHDVTTIWKRNVCSFVVTLNAFDVRPMCDTADVQAILPLPPFGENGIIAWTSAVSHVGRTSNAFKVTTKLQTFLFQMVVTSHISVQYLWKYGFAKSSDTLYAPCTFKNPNNYQEIPPLAFVPNKEPISPVIQYHFTAI